MRLAWIKKAWFFCLFLKRSKLSSIPVHYYFYGIPCKKQLFFFNRWHACIWKCLLICPWIISHDVHVIGKWHLSPFLQFLMPNCSIVYDSFSKMSPVAMDEITERMQTNNLDSQISASFQLVLTGTQSVQAVLLTLIVAEYRLSLLAVNLLYL